MEPIVTAKGHLSCPANQSSRMGLVCKQPAGGTGHSQVTSAGGELRFSLTPQSIFLILMKSQNNSLPKCPSEGRCLLWSGHQVRVALVITRDHSAFVFSVVLTRTGFGQRWLEAGKIVCLEP